MNIKFLADSRLPTSVLHIKPKAASPLSPLFVWIPGNPGIVQYYKEFLTKLHEKHESWEILAISHAGMAIEDPELQSRRATIYTLEDQIQHKVEIINQFSRENRLLVIMGHSVGAYMAQHVIMDENLVGKVIKLGLITPTIVDIHLSQKGTRLTKGFHWIRNLPDIAAMASDFLFNKLASIMYTDQLISFLMGVDKDSVPVTTSRSLVQHPEIIRQALGLAALEMQQIRGTWLFQKELINYCNSREIETKFVFSADDPWVSDVTRESLLVFFRENYKDRNLEISISQELAHSFVIKHSKYTVDEYF